MLVPTEVFTQGQRLLGMVDTHDVRVVDTLNAATESYVILQSAQMIQLMGSLQQATPLGLVRMAKNVISFIVPHEKDEMTPEQAHRRLYAYRPTLSKPVLLCLPNYELRGNIHLTRTGILSPESLTELPGRDFMPLTGASVVYLPRPNVAFKAGVILVNKALIQVNASLNPDSGTGR